MPHVSFITLSGFRIHKPDLLELGLSLPGFQDRASALSQLPALGLITLAGMLPESWTSSYHSPVETQNGFVELVLRDQPDLVAISALTPSVTEAYTLSDSFRVQHVKTVIGGLHVSTCPDEASQHADAVVVGSGEPVWLELLADSERQNLKPRYIAGRNQRTAEWSMPRFDLLGNVQRYTLQTQRGCPLACDFCAASRLIEQFREKPAKNIRQELAAIKKLKKNALVELADDNTFAGERDVHEFFDILEEADIRWFTEADWRLGERPEILKRLAAAGCVQILTGIESLVFRYPGMAQKNVELNRMIDACHAIQEAGVCVNGCFILGAQGETEESIDRLTQFLLESTFAELQVTLQTPFPGTALYRRLQQSGRLLPERDWSFYTLFDVTYQPDLLSVEQLENGFQEMIQNVYGPSATLRRKKIRKYIWRGNSRLYPTSN